MSVEDGPLCRGSGLNLQLIVQLGIDLGKLPIQPSLLLPSMSDLAGRQSGESLLDADVVLSETKGSRGTLLPEMKPQ